MRLVLDSNEYIFAFGLSPQPFAWRMATPPASVVATPS
jgi:hypothetical protein